MIYDNNTHLGFTNETYTPFLFIFEKYKHFTDVIFIFI